MKPDQQSENGDSETCVDSNIQFPLDSVHISVDSGSEAETLTYEREKKISNHICHSHQYCTSIHLF